MRNIFRKVVIFLIGLTLTGIGMMGGYTYYQMNQLTMDISKTKESLGISDDTKKEIQSIQEQAGISEKGIINIALYGIDSRDKNDSSNSRSDSVIILTIDKTHNKIKLSSIMRDTYVKIDGHGKDKLTHAYAFGGPQLAIKTLNQNLGLNIEDFVTVDFFGLENIIDSMGGINLSVKQNEVNEINKFIKEVAILENKTPVLLKHSGMQHMNGMQAVAYGRIRHVGNGDYERTDRQREVLSAMFDKIKSLGPNQFIKLVPECSKYIKTSLSLTKMMSIGTEVLKNKSISIEQQRFPKNEHSKEETINKVWYLVADLNKTKTSLRDFIYEVNLNKK